MAALTLLVLFGCPGSPTAFRCDPVTGADCDAGVSYDGTWSLQIVVDQPVGTQGRTVTTPFQVLRATMGNVKLETTGDGSTRVLAPGLVGPCCSPAPTISPRLALEPQRFTVTAGTPMTITLADRPAMPYNSVDAWALSLVDELKGTASGTNVLRFERGRATVIDYEGAEPLNVYIAVEFTR